MQDPDRRQMAPGESVETAKQDVSQTSSSVGAAGWDKDSVWDQLSQELPAGTADKFATANALAPQETAVSKLSTLDKDGFAAAHRVVSTLKRGHERLVRGGYRHERVDIAAKTIDRLFQGPKGRRLADIPADPHDPRDATALLRRYAPQLRSYLHPASAENDFKAAVDSGIAELNHEFVALVREFGNRREVRAEAIVLLALIGRELIRNAGLERATGEPQR
jgi:hypothetical protein